MKNEEYMILNEVDHFDIEENVEFFIFTLRFKTEKDILEHIENKIKEFLKEKEKKMFRFMILSFQDIDSSRCILKYKMEDLSAQIQIIQFNQLDKCENQELKSFLKALLENNPDLYEGKDSSLKKALEVGQTMKDDSMEVEALEELIQEAKKK